LRATEEVAFVVSGGGKAQLESKVMLSLKKL
jgi:hypothetical protein